jgi:soluble lytic murein transglycosylase-like protein
MSSRGTSQTLASRFFPDFRLICDCQQHRRVRLWRRGVGYAARALAILISVPLAFAAFDFPTSAMNLNLASFGSARQSAPEQPKLHAAASPLSAAEESFFEVATFPVFATPRSREQFISGADGDITLEVFREEYFRQHVPYGAIIHREARRNNLAPELVAAIIQTESNFKPHLVSSKSAQGLMQIVPGTARFLNLSDPFDPEKNIVAGTRYYRYLHNRFKNHTLALAAYNAGEGNVERYKGIPPFRETQQYVVKVNREMRRYRQRIESSYARALLPDGF